MNASTITNVIGTIGSIAWAYNIVDGIIKVYSEKTYIHGKINPVKVRNLNTKNLNINNYKDVKIKYNKDIEEFKKVLKEKLPYVDLTYLERNLQDLVINEFPTLGTPVGTYDSKNNIIGLIEDDESKSITHELLHLSSSIYSGKRVFCGFRQRENNFSFGICLNEAYTSILDKRNFKNDNESYLVFRPLAQAIETIVGKENMEKMYFKADLNGLIHELSKYSSEDEIYKLIRNMDEIFNILYKHNKDNIEYDEKDVYKVSVYSEECVRILTNCLITKVGEMLGENESNEQILKFNDDFVEAISCGYEIKNLKIKYLTQKIYDEEMNYYINNTNDLDGKKIV